MRYDPAKIEKKWRAKWLKERIYEPSLALAKKPFYNLMMFPYPSAEGLHVGNVYAFVGSDIFGRFQRMKGRDVFQPIGLDGFGIHSENYALKVGRHPARQAKISEKNFYRQLGLIGNGFAWRERLETYDPQYYKWTQWIFAEMFKRGLAYRKQAKVNWCPSCKTVLADEQAVSGKCERCGSAVVKKDLEQWFFKITDYAERLLKNLEAMDWSERVKIAQRNWIGKSEGAIIDFEIAGGIKSSYVLLYGYEGSPDKNFFPWLKKELESRGAKVYVPKLPQSNDPRVHEQVLSVLRLVPFDENTVLVGHSLGGVVALKILEQLKEPIRKTVLAASFCENTFIDEPFESHTFDWKFNTERIKANMGELRILRDTTDDSVPQYQADNLRDLFGGAVFDFAAQKPHVRGTREPEVLHHCIDSIPVFTTRPDTLFGATYMVLAPEHELISKIKNQISNIKEVENYIKNAAKKSEMERTAETKEKTGVELKGVKAVNPATKKEIPVWVADYVLAGYGTGAIMAVPAHDERDWEFVQYVIAPETREPGDKFIRSVVKLNSYKELIPYLGFIPDNQNEEREAKKSFKQLLQNKFCYSGYGVSINSGKFSGLNSNEAKWEITKFAGGKRMSQYRLRDWLISRQRYWGPPIPMIYCEKCALEKKGKRKDMPGWYPVPEKDLPVKLPFIKDFRPRGKGESPLASVKSFYEARCPSCQSKARRETDVSDTFLDSAWYFLRYPSVHAKNSKLEIRNLKLEIPWNQKITRRWLPVDMYIGGAEHSVLHLLYSRFLAMVFHDWKLVDFEEPFSVFRAHGLIVKNGAKMSKSKGNVVNPDEYIRAYGADALRLYLMFTGPFQEGGDFRDAGIAGMTRFLQRIWRFYTGHKAGIGAKEITRLAHRTAKKVTEDIENLQYHTAISALMVLMNAFEVDPTKVPRESRKMFLKLLAPFAPHIAEELWRAAGEKKSVHRSPWPNYDPKQIQESMFEMVIQVNGRVRGKIPVAMGITEAEARRTAKASGILKKYWRGEPKRVIFVPDRLINFVFSA